MLFVLGIFLILAPIVFFIPKDGWNIGGFKLNFLTSEQFIHPPKQEKKDISKIVSDVDTLSIEVDPLLQHKNGSDGSMGAPSGGELSTESSTIIHMNETGNKTFIAYLKNYKMLQAKNVKFIFFITVILKSKVIE